MCEVGYSGAAMSHFTDLLGDPLCRVRHSPSFLLLVAEMVSGPQKGIVGLVRGRIKTVACGTPCFVITLTDDAPHRPIFAKMDLRNCPVAGEGGSH
ncbi:Acetyltransferase (GNAT) family [Musa troglodytarum]|uniref:Acetyltransferase (GNAT) family n=1 Tax=Musa troglodytarum TaxID=320322 RepID=A0A9E7GFK7_9LILI|nr:Acetyltransferase (GNAT) family [Musa troglodytarum]